MLLFGWGRRSRALQISDRLAVIRNYGYFHIFFFAVAPLGSSYVLATLTDDGWAHRDLNKSDAATLLDGRPLRPSVGDRFSLVTGILAITICSLGWSLSRPR